MKRLFLYSIVIGGSGLGVITGLLRESTVARVFGTSAVADAIVVGVAIPDFLTTLLINPIVNGSGMRLLRDAETTGRTVQAATALSITGLVVVIPIGCLAILAPRSLVTLFAPAISGATLQAAAQIAPFAAIAGGLLYLAAVLAALLNLKGHARYTTWAQSVPALGIVFVLLAAGHFRAIAYGIGLIAGASAFCAILLWRLVGLPGHASWTLIGQGHWARLMAPLVAPSLALMSVAMLWQVLVTIQRSVALHASTGSLAELTYAYRITSLPVVLVTGLLGSVLFVELLRAKSHESFGADLFRAASLVGLLMTFAAAVLFANASIVVRTVFEHGAFATTSAHATADFVRLFSLAIPLQAVTGLLAFALYAKGRAWKAALVSWIALTAQVGLLLGLALYLNATAVPLALVAGLLITAGVQGWVLRSEHDFAKWRTSVLLTAVYGACCALAISLLRGAWQPALGGEIVFVVASCAILGLGACPFFFLLSKVFGRARSEAPRFSRSPRDGSARPLLVFVHTSLRRDLYDPIRFFTAFRTTQLFQTAPYMDMNPSETSAIRYEGPVDLFRKLRTLGPDVIGGVDPFVIRHLPQAIAILAYASIYGTGLVVASLENRPLKEKWNGPLSLLLRVILRPYVRRADLVFAVNRGAEANLISVGAAPERLIRRLYGCWGVDTTEYSPDGARYDMEAKEPIVMFIGRIDESKGVFDLILAFADVVRRTEVKLIFVGDGPDQGRLKDFIAELGLAGDVRLLGTRLNREIPVLLRSATILAAPSRTTKKWAEQVGMSLLQALACGVPVVSTDSGSIGEFVRNGETGLLVPEGDTPALAAAIYRLITDPELLQQFKDRARAVSLAKYDAAHNVALVEDLILKATTSGTLAVA